MNEAGAKTADVCRVLAGLFLPARAFSGKVGFRFSAENATT
jgi:hypothetical protein